jgi:hypothetical protein
MRISWRGFKRSSHPTMCMTGNMTGRSKWGYWRRFVTIHLVCWRNQGEEGGSKILIKRYSRFINRIWNNLGVRAVINSRMELAIKNSKKLLIKQGRISWAEKWLNN